MANHGEVARSKVKLGMMGQNSMFGQDAMMGRMMCNAFIDRSFNNQPSGGSAHIEENRSLKRRKSLLALEDVKKHEELEPDIKKEAASKEAKTNENEDDQRDAGTATVDSMAANIQAQLESNKGPKDTKPAAKKPAKSKNQDKTKDKKVQESKVSKSKVCERN